MPIIEASLLAKQFARFGLDVPPAATAAFTAWNTANAALESTDVEDLRAAILAGTITDKNIVAQVQAAALANATRDGYRQLVAELDRPLGSVAFGALRAEADSVLDRLRPMFLEQAVHVVEAGRWFDVDTFADPARTLTRSPGAAASFHACTTALGECEEMARLVGEVCNLAASRQSPPMWSLFVATTGEMRPGDLSGAFSGGSTRWLALYRLSGVEPALNAPAEAQRIASEAAAREQAASVRPLSRADVLRNESIRRHQANVEATVPK